VSITCASMIFRYKRNIWKRRYLEKRKICWSSIICVWALLWCKIL